jgi:hypothetical protein
MDVADRKRYRDRANRAWRELRKEKDRGGFINDGPGRRYRVGVYFLLAGDVAAASLAFDWFDAEFGDDVGEPVFFLYGALAAHRSDEPAKARRRLLLTMQSNIYLLPFLAGKALPPLEIWHSSNRHQPGYLLEIEPFLAEPSKDECCWIGLELETPPFQKLRDGYLSTFFALKDEADFDKRRAILTAWRTLEAECFGMIAAV